MFKNFFNLIFVISGVIASFLKSFYHIPLTWSSTVTQPFEGCTFQTILCVLQFSWVLILPTFCFNFCLCYLIPVSYISNVEDILKLDFKLGTEAKKLQQQQNELPRALFLAYGNMFTWIRPVETLTHMRVSQVVLLQVS